METNAKLNEHPHCSCPACRNGAGSKTGQATHRAVNRRIRHLSRLALSRVTVADCDVLPVIVPTPFTN
jgi:hypothetical protein